MYVLSLAACSIKTFVPPSIGNGLVIEAPNDDGVMQFKVDATGAWLYNSTFVLAKDGGGKILIDPRYGIASGKGDLYTTNGTTVTPSFIDEDGKIVFDDDITLKGLKIPKGTNFYIDANDGKAYFRGNIYAEDGIFNGTVYAKDGEFTGKITATSGEFSGELKGASGTFSGTLKAGKIDGGMISGTIKSDEKTGGALEGVSLNIGNGNFTVDSAGNVTIKSGNISWGAVTGTDAIDQKIDNAQSTANSAVTKANSAQSRADDAMSTAEGAADDVLALAKGQYSAPKATFIDGTSIKSPKIYGGEFYGNTFNVISESNGNGSFSLYGMYNNKQYHMFEISYYPSDYPEVTLMSPDGARIVIGKEGSSNEIVFYGDVDFSSATVTGVAATFG